MKELIAAFNASMLIMGLLLAGSDSNMMPWPNIGGVFMVLLGLRFVL